MNLKVKKRLKIVAASKKKCEPLINYCLICKKKPKKALENVRGKDNCQKIEPGKFKLLSLHTIDVKLDLSVMPLPPPEK